MKFSQMYSRMSSRVPQSATKWNEVVEHVENFVENIVKTGEFSTRKSRRGGEALLSGEYSHSLDAKGRIILPAKLREEIGDSFYVTKGFENCLAVYSSGEFENLSASINALPGNMREARRLQRIIISGAHSCEADKQGRFVIPPQLREFASLDKDVVIVGNGNHAEIWNTEAWNEYLYGEDSLSLEDAAEALRAAGLSM